MRAGRRRPRGGPQPRAAAAAALGSALLLAAPCAAAEAGRGVLTLEALSATRERPLFVPDRRPPVPPAEPDVAEPPAPPPPPAPPALVPPPDAVLVGIVFGPSVRTAVVRAAGGGRTLTVKAGDTLDGWTVLAVDPATVVIGHAEERRTLALRPALPASE